MGATRHSATCAKNGFTILTRPTGTQSYFHCSCGADLAVVMDAFDEAKAEIRRLEVDLARAMAGELPESRPYVES